MWLFTILVLLATLLWYYSKKRKLTFWQQRGFPTLPAANFFFGDCTGPILGRRSFTEFYRDAHVHFKRRGAKVGGIYLMNLPMLVVADSALMKAMLQTDFDAFADRGIDLDAKNNPLSANMFSLDGDAWQQIRRKLSPTFTSGKMKNMFPIVERHIDALTVATRRICGDGTIDVEYPPWLDRVGIDIIAHVAFGLDCKTIEHEDDKFFEMTQRIMHAPKWKVAKMLLTGLTNPANIVALLSADKELSDFFIKMIEETVEHRRRNGVKANDFLQLMLDVAEDDAGGLTMLEIAAEAFLFFIAGFETTTRTITFTMFELAQRQDIQDKLRAELQREFEEHNGYNYDWVVNNEYLDMAVKEALRLYPPVMTLNRMSTRDYKLEELGLTIPARTCIVFSSLGFHHDPENFEDPLEYKPERFDKANARRIKPFTYIPFGEGPRFCIGKRFGLMQSKLNLAKLLLNFKVLPSKLTEYPMKINPVTTSLLLTTRSPVYFRLEPLQT